MDAKTFDNSKLPGCHVTGGQKRAPHRSYHYVMGLTERQIDIDFDEAKLDARMTARGRPATPYQSGVLGKYAEQVGSAQNSSVAHAGEKAEIDCYADI